MAYNVTSSFISLSRSKTPPVVRKFTIATSDYSDRVLKWPRISRAWDEIRPKTIRVSFANADQGMNFLRNDKTLMVGECLLSMGFNSPVKYTNVSSLSYASKSIDVSVDASDPKMQFKDDGSKVYLQDRVSNLLHQWDVSSFYHIDTATDDAISKSIQEVSLVGEDFQIVDNGSKLISLSADGEARRWSMSPSWGIASLIDDNNESNISGEFGTPRAMFIHPNGTRIFILASKSATTQQHIYAWNITTPWDMTLVTGTPDFDLDINTVVGPFGQALWLSNDGLRFYVVDNNNDTVYQWSMTTAYDPTTATQDEEFDISSETGLVFGLTFADNDSKMYISSSDTDVIFQYDMLDGGAGEELIDLFTGKIASIRYSNEKCDISITDKFQQLSERKVGASDATVDYIGSNYLPSDIAWWVVTSYGGYSGITSTSNPDIDYVAFNDWAAIFSGDSVFVQGQFDGQKCTEILRKIARNTHSAIFIKENKLSFHRFGLADATVTSMGPGELMDVNLAFSLNDIVNKQYVSGDYDVDSDFHQFTVVDVRTISVDSFGIHENIILDNNFWYVDSASAINFAQRLGLANADPDDSIQTQAGLVGLPRLIGETITVLDAFHNISESYRVLDHEVDMDKATTRFRIDRTQLTNAFILDTSTLGNTVEVLT